MRTRSHSGVRNQISSSTNDWKLLTGASHKANAETVAAGLISASKEEVAVLASIRTRGLDDAGKTAVGKIIVDGHLAQVRVSPQHLEVAFSLDPKGISEHIAFRLLELRDTDLRYAIDRIKYDFPASVRSRLAQEIESSLNILDGEVDQVRRGTLTDLIVDLRRR